jgi:DNA-directed RNA polymerase specialized sigma24 family protein
LAGAEDEAYHEYVNGLLSGMRRVAYLLCHDWHRADDLVQSAFERLYVHWDKARQAADPAAYARTVLVWVYLSEQRAGWARRVVLLDGGLETAARAGPDLESRLEMEAAGEGDFGVGRRPG